MTISMMTFIIFTYIDTLMIGILMPEAASVGYYRAALNIVIAVGGILNITAVLFPIFTKMERGKRL